MFSGTPIGRLVMLCAGVVALGVPALARTQAADPPSATARVAWGFDRSDLTPHPGVRFGVLPTGMRYALMRHAVPAGSLSVRLHLDAGSSVEAVGQSGYMHLLEHLIFHGSANLPRGALLLMLPHAGMKRFADFGATTSYDETVYRLELAKADGRARETALTVMREIGRDLSFGRRTVESAKKEVQAEIAARDGVADRLAAAQNAFFFPGTPIARGSVLGTRRSVARASGGALQRLYADHYVPSRATLVMVGDFDPALAEAEIAARMSEWQGGRGFAVPEVRAAPATRGVLTRLFVDRAGATRVAIAAVAPLGGPDASAPRDAAFLQHLGAEMLGRRLARGATGSGATSSVYDHFSTGRLSLIELPAPGGNWRGALATGASALASVLDTGFTQAELDEQIAASRRALASSATPQTSAALADGIVDAVGRGILFTAPGDGSATDAYLARVRLADVNAAFRAAWASPGRLIFVSHDRTFANAEAEIASAWSQAR